MISINHYHHFDDKTLTLLNKILNKENIIMATMQELRDAVERNITVDASIITLLNGISQQLKDALANNDPVALQAVIDTLDADTKNISDAIVANTPAA